MTKTRRFTPTFKAQVPLEALREERAVQQNAAHHGEHPNQASQCECNAREALEEVFERCTARWEKRLEHVPYLNPAFRSVRRGFLREDMVCASSGGFHSNLRQRIPSTSAG